jgi:hypothetical protein
MAATLMLKVGGRLFVDKNRLALHAVQKAAFKKFDCRPLKS